MLEYTKTEWQDKNSEGNIPEGAPPINAANLNKIENGLSYLFGFIGANIKGEEIWKNDNSDSEKFGETLIEKDLSKYHRFTILLKAISNVEVYCEHTITIKDYKIFLNVGRVGDVDRDAGRCVKITNNGIEFFNGQRGGTTSTSSTNYNNYAIPVKVIGYEC